MRLPWTKPPETEKEKTALSAVKRAGAENRLAVQRLLDEIYQDTVEDLIDPDAKYRRKRAQ